MLLTIYQFNKYITIMLKKMSTILDCCVYIHNHFSI